MTTTMIIGFFLIGFIILGFLVATALLVDHPDIEPVQPICDDTSIFDNDFDNDTDEILGITPGPLNPDDYESIIDKYWLNSV